MTLPFHIAAALFVHSYGRPPRRREHAALGRAVDAAYKHLRVRPSADPTEVLRQLQSNASVREVLDVALDGPAVSQPHSFVMHLEELAQTAQRHKTFVIEHVGCLAHHHGSYYLINETTTKRITLSDLFAKRRPCRSVIVLQVGALGAPPLGPQH